MAINPQRFSGYPAAIGATIRRLDLSFRLQGLAETLERDILKRQVCDRTFFPQLGNQVVVEFNKLIQTELLNARQRKCGCFSGACQARLRAWAMLAQCYFPVMLWVLGHSNSRYVNAQRAVPEEKNDDWSPHENEAVIAALTSDRRVAPVPETGHLGREDRPKVVVAAVLTGLCSNRSSVVSVSASLPFTISLMSLSGRFGECRSAVSRRVEQWLCAASIG